jgi:hypothetical protein
MPATWRRLKLDNSQTEIEAVEKGLRRSEVNGGEK